MVFAGLHEHDKEAFFSLLDEYFQSRPHLLAGQGHGDQAVQGITPAQAAATASAGAAVFGRAMAANPRATTAIVNAGLRSAGAPKGVQLATPPPQTHTAADEQEADDTTANKTSVADRIARFGAGLKPPAPMPSPKPGNSFVKPSAPPPPAPPRLPGRAARTPEPQEEEVEEELPAPEPPRRTVAPKAPSSPPSGLVTTQSLGNYDTSSKGAFAASLVTRKGPARRQDSVTPPIPSAFAPKPQQNFAPPPVRRVPSDSGSARKTPPVPKREEIEQEEEAGEWADVLYDYNSGEPTDLVIQEGQRILVIEKSSPDWWKGQFNGKEGLFPSSYVRIL